MNETQSKIKSKNSPWLKQTNCEEDKHGEYYCNCNHITKNAAMDRIKRNDCLIVSSRYPLFMIFLKGWTELLLKWSIKTMESSVHFWSRIHLNIMETWLLEKFTPQLFFSWQIIIVFPFQDFLRGFIFPPLANRFGAEPLEVVPADISAWVETIQTTVVKLWRHLDKSVNAD